jgi:hypothetical protein
VIIDRGREWVDCGGEANTCYLKLESDDDRVPSITLQKIYNFDAAFYEWFRELRNLDAMDQLKHRPSASGR